MARRPILVCPEKCSGGYSDRQHDLTDLQVTKIDGTAKRMIDQDGGGSRCSYCGAVYVGGGPTLGFLNDEILGSGWHPKGI